MADMFALNTYDKFYISGVLNNPIYTFMVRPVFVAFEFGDFFYQPQKEVRLTDL